MNTTAKKRIPISRDLSAEVMFASRDTCCKCNERGKALQIHHIDEDPSNNNFENLCVLCLECHNETQIRGGFGKKLTKELVVKYNCDWQKRVKYIREEVDKILISKMSADLLNIMLAPTMQHTRNGSFLDVIITDHKPKSKVQTDIVRAYINSLPDLKKALHKMTQPEFDTGVTSRMVNASYDYIDALEGVLTYLSRFYADGSFGGNAPMFFSNAISQRFKWHRSIAEPLGTGTGGTIVSVLVCGSVMADVESMVKDMALNLADDDHEFEYKKWLDEWDASSPSS
jgi:hypothetical protein